MYYPPCGVYSDTYAKDITVVRTRFQWVMLAGFIALLLGFPAYPFVSEDILRVFISIVILIITVEGINIVTGYCGQITLGQAAFMLMAGNLTGMLHMYIIGPVLAAAGLGWLSFWIYLPIVTIVSVLVGLFFALPTAKVKELYLALTTLAAHFIIFWMMRWVPKMLGMHQAVTGMPVPAPAIGGFAFDTPFKFYYFALFFCILMTFFAKSLARSGIGRAFVAIRDNDLAAEAIGVNIFRYKLLAFAICSAYASVSAVLYVSFTGYTNPELFTFMDTVWFFGMAMIGGFGSTVGPIFGTIFISLLRQMVVRAGPAMATALPFMKVGSQSGILIMVFGIVLALFLIFEPRGIAHRWEILKNQGRLWPFAY